MNVDNECLLHKGDSIKVDNDAIALMETANVKTKWLCDMMKISCFIKSVYDKQQISTLSMLARLKTIDTLSQDHGLLP